MGVPEIGMSEYMRRRYHERREAALDYLGGECVICGTTENLEFDHIDPKTKELAISKMWSVSEERFWTEIGKCQLLCESCHKEKHSPGHGTLSMYRYCKCELCKKAKSDYMKAYKKISRPHGIPGL